MSLQDDSNRQPFKGQLKKINDGIMVLMTKNPLVALELFNGLYFPNRIPYFETSAATGTEVDKAVITLLDLVMKRMEQCVDKPPAEPANGNGAAKLSEGQPNEKKCAC